MASLIVVLGAHYWGSGPTLKEAKKVFKNVGGDLTNGYTVLAFADAGDYHGVDDLGQVHYTIGHEPIVVDEVKPTKSSR